MDKERNKDNSSPRLDRLIELLIEELKERKEKRIPNTDVVRAIIKVLGQFTGVLNAIGDSQLAEKWRIYRIIADFIQDTIHIQNTENAEHKLERT